MNREEQAREGNVEIQLNETGALTKLKIQRLGNNEFFVSISEKEQISYLKKKILAFIKAEQEVAEDLALSLSNLRLIYKGKVLKDSKSVEFYKMQNEDTIQLCPIRQKKRPEPQTTPAGGPAENSGAEVQSGERQEQQSSEFTFVSFALIEQPAPSGGSSRSTVNSPTSNLEQKTPEPSIELSSATTNVRRRVVLSMRNGPTPVTVIGKLRNFKCILQDTLRRLSVTNVDNSRELITPLNELIRKAVTLRGGLSPPEEKEDVPWTPRESHTSNLEEELVISHTGSIDLPAPRPVPYVSRYLPLRLNNRALSEFQIVGNNWNNHVDGSVGLVDQDSAQTAGATGSISEPDYFNSN